MNWLHHNCYTVSLLLCAAFALSFGPQTAQAAEAYKQLPPRGIELPKETHAKLETSTKELRRLLDRAVANSKDADLWRPDVEVFVRSVELALEQNLFYGKKDSQAAIRALQIGLQRLDAVAKGVRGIGLLAIGTGGKGEGRTLAGGFISKIDGSVQPFGLVMPESSLSVDGQRFRMDVWLHGRGDTTTEVPFLLERLNRIGEYSPPGVVVLHPFGRHCNAFKFAGEVDVYEAMEHVQSLIQVDPARIAIRGFSMGGAGCWHLAAHDPGQWFAANPGAGFVDTVKYQGWEKGFPYEPGDWGRKLLAWYDVPPWVENLSNTHVIAYSGEVDKQRAAAELMIEATKGSAKLKELGFEIKHVIGKDMGHKIDRPSASKIDAALALLEKEVGKEPRKKIHFVTHMLRYHRVDWLEVLGINEHWVPAIVDATLDDRARVTVRVNTNNVSSLRLNFSSKEGWPMESGFLAIVIDGEELDGPAVIKGKPFTMSLSKVDGIWTEGELDQVTPRKRPGLQGPIDDAYMSSFLFVLPSRPCRHGVVQRFVDRELEHARTTWRKIMRGNDRVVIDTELTAQQIAENNLICFGDFNSNRYLASIASALPVQWTDEKIVVGEQTFDPAKHAVVMVYPNPQAPDRYVVANGAISFREFSNNTNSRQIAMLPDWAVLDVTQPSDQIFPGRVVAADFFDETWRLRAQQKSTN